MESMNYLCDKRARFHTGNIKNECSKIKKKKSAMHRRELNEDVWDKKKNKNKNRVATAETGDV